MFVYEFTPLDLLFDEARGRLLRSERLTPTGGQGRVVALTASRLPFAKEVRIEFDRPFEDDGIVSLPLRWSPTGPGAMFPRFDGDLELSRLGDGGAHLSLVGRYDPPLGRVGGALDRAFLHHVAEAGVRHLVTDVAASLLDPAPDGAGFTSKGPVQS